MKSDLSPAVERAITAANEWRVQSSKSYLDGHLLLLGLTDEEDGKAAVLIERYGGSLHSLRKWLVETEILEQIPLQDVLRHAQELARRHGSDSTVTGDFFLLALFRTHEHLTNHLAQLGINIPGIEEAILGASYMTLEMEPIGLSDPAEQISTGRILDVNANRATEALRLLDDYCRFVLEDAFLTRELKTLRHDLVECLLLFPESLLIPSRETQQDVGITISTDQEMRRNSPNQIAKVNFKRLQEALRSLEEYGKLFASEVAKRLEAIRYRSYTLEKAIFHTSKARQKLEHANLYVLLTGSQCEAGLDWTIEEAAAGGASIFQLREKELSDRELLNRARRFRRWTRKAKALFILNDRPDIARLAEADGVHLGQDDMPIKEARQILGPEAIIGVSTHNLQQLHQAILDGADYIGVGPTFPSETKAFSEFAGLEFVRAAIQETSIPAFVIGGINQDTIDAVLNAGAERVAVSSAIAKATEPKLVALTLREALDRSKNRNIFSS